MPISGQRTIIGPKTLQIPAPSVQAAGLNLFGERTLTVNTGPRAGQNWEILSASYRFPNAKRNNEGTITGSKLNFTYGISMTANGVLVAEQEYAESQTANTPTAEPSIPVHFLGSLEPFAPAMVFAGQSLLFSYDVTKNFTGVTFIESGLGEIVVSYNLVRFDRARSR